MFRLDGLVIKEEVERERFINSVCAVSGRSRKAAYRLDAKIQALSLRGGQSLGEIRKMWMRRYCEGWSYRFQRLRGLPR